MGACPFRVGLKNHKLYTEVSSDESPKTTSAPAHHSKTNYLLLRIHMCAIVYKRRDQEAVNLFVDKF